MIQYEYQRSVFCMYLKKRRFGIVGISGIVIILCSALGLTVYGAEISGVKIANVTGTSATVEWKTDVPTDATVHFGLDSRVGIVRDPDFNKKDHSLMIDDLEPGMTYHVRVLSSDEKGNKVTSAGFVFETKNVEEKIKERIIKDLDKIKDPESIIEIDEKVKDVAGDILKPPTILGLPRVTVDQTTATIVWTTDRESSSMVYLAPEADYVEGIDYPIAQGDPNEEVTRHVVEVIGLDPSTTYHFKVVSSDSIGLTSESEDDTFKTKSILPAIRNVNVTRIQEKTAVVNWNTSGVLARGIVEYTNTRTKVTKVAGSSVFATQQSVQLSELEFGTRYSAVIRSTNQDGEGSASTPFQFVTIRDVIAPAISKVKNESTLFPGEEVKIQTIIAWETDEPAYCQVFYSQGLKVGDSDEGESLPKETNPLTSHTQVIVGFAPSTVYQFWMKCNDDGQNESRSEDFVLITPIKEKSIIDVILENFQGTFGWVNNIGG
jgi:hypothetical protein